MPDFLCQDCGPTLPALFQTQNVQAPPVEKRLWHNEVCSGGLHMLSQPALSSQYTLSSVELSLPDPQQTPLRKGPPTGNTDLQQLPK